MRWCLRSNELPRALSLCLPHAHVHVRQLGATKAEAKEQRRISRETHAQILQGLVTSAQQVEALQTALEDCKSEYGRSRAASEARHGELVADLRRVKAHEAEVQRQLEEQQTRTRRAESVASGSLSLSSCRQLPSAVTCHELSGHLILLCLLACLLTVSPELQSQLLEAEACNKDIAAKIALAETEAQVTLPTHPHAFVLVSCCLLLLFRPIFTVRSPSGAILAGMFLGTLGCCVNLSIRSHVLKQCAATRCNAGKGCQEARRLFGRA